MSEIDYKKIPLNVLVDDPEFDKLNTIPDELYKDISRSKSTSFPEEYTRSTVVPVFNQGSIGSCVGCAGKVVVSDPMYPSTDLSAMWLYKRAQFYDQWRGENYSGTSINGACLALKQEGICEEKFYPYTSDSHTSGAFENALIRKIDDYYGISMNDVDKIKLLLQKQSLWTSFYVKSEFYNIGSDGFLRNESGYISSPDRGGHAVAMVGWTHKEGKLYWKFQNSWGKFWGNRGFFYMSNELYSRITKGVYYIDIKGTTPNTKKNFFDILFGIPVRLFSKLASIFHRLTS